MNNSFGNSVLETGQYFDLKAEQIISQLSQDETGKRQYYRPVYSLHKWWARRPGTLFRSIIIRTIEKKNHLFFSELNGDISETSEYFSDHNYSSYKILDPFMGGGTTLVEANRLGAKVVGCDINPVSYWIVRETLKSINTEKLREYFDKLELEVSPKIKSLFKTKNPFNGEECDSLYNFWVKTIKCNNCGNEVLLHKRCLLNEGLSRNFGISEKNPATCFCPECYALCEWAGIDFCVCKNCKSKFRPEVGNYDKGFYQCNKCKVEHQSLIQAIKGGNEFSQKLIAIEFWDSITQKRLYKSPDKFDIKLIKNIEDFFLKNQEKLVFPKQSILPGESSVRWRLHNYKYYFEVFTKRQLIAINYIISSIVKIHEDDYRDAFITILSNSLEYNNMMTPYNYPHRKLHHLFNYHALPLTTTPVENVVWGVGNEGAGTFKNCFERYYEAKKYCKNPFDKYKDSNGRIHTVFAKKENIAASFVDKYELLEVTDKGAMLFCGDSANLRSIPNNVIDYVITDPPYFGSIHYSELSNFFYVWLRELVDGQIFESENVPTEKEAIVNSVMEKGYEDYLDLMTKVWKESNRVLNDFGKLIFTFHHKDDYAWWIIYESLFLSGFAVVDYFPVMSEYKVNPHIRNKDSLDMDLVLICEKSSNKTRHDKDKIIIDFKNKSLKRVMNIDKKLNGNAYFLTSMGEVLKTISESRDMIDYSTFSLLLSNISKHDLNINYQKSDEEYSYQLRLMDKKKELKK